MMFHSTPNRRDRLRDVVACPTAPLTILIPTTNVRVGRRAHCRSGCLILAIDSDKLWQPPSHAIYHSKSLVG
jgi:hypothetical protein